MRAANIDGVAFRACIPKSEATAAFSEPDTYERRIMSEGIVPLRRISEEDRAFDRFDVAAVALLIGGQATSLQAAQAEAILNDLRAQRDQMVTVLSDVRGRGLTGHAEIDEANANLITAINSGIVQVDLFIARAQVVAETTPLASKQPGLRIEP